MRNASAKQMLVAGAATLAISALALAGCSNPATSNGSAPASASSASVSSASSPSASASSASASESPSAMTGLANPWSDAATAAEAAQGAGLPDFTVPEAATELVIARIDPWSFRYMEGVAEAETSAGAAGLTVRKGWAVEGGDISGDYNTYKCTWTQDVGSVKVTCFGHVEGRAVKALWAMGGFDYCILAEALGGDDQEAAAFGLDAADVATLVNSVR